MQRLGFEAPRHQSKSGNPWIRFAGERTRAVRERKMSEGLRDRTCPETKSAGQSFSSNLLNATGSVTREPMGTRDHFAS